MSGKTDFPVSITLKAVDKATAPVRALSMRLTQLTAPMKAIGERFGKFGTAISGLSAASGLTTVASGVSGVGKAMGNIGSSALNVGARFAALGAVAGVALWGVVKDTMEVSDKLGEMAGRVGLSVDAYASLQYAAGQADVEQEAFNSSMDKFNKNLGEMTVGKGGEFLAFLNKISPALAKQMKAAKGTEAGLSIMTDAFSKIEDPGKRAALASAAFGKSGLQMGSFLAQGGAAVQAQQRHYFDLVGSQEAVAATAGALDNQIKDLSLSFKGLQTTALGALFPAFTQLGKALTDFMVKNRDGLQRWATNTATAIQKWIDGGGLERLAASVTLFAERASWLFDKIGGLTGALTALALVISAPLISAIVSAIPAVYSLGVALLTTPVGWFLLAVAAIAGSAWLIYENWGEISAFFQKTLGDFEDLGNGFLEFQAGLLTLDFDRMFSGWTRGVEGFKAALLDVIKISQYLPGIGMLSGALVQSGAAESVLGNSTKNEPIVAPLQNPRGGGGEAKISVDFANLPRGARVTTDPASNQSVDVSMGYSMASGSL